MVKVVVLPVYYTPAIYGVGCGYNHISIAGFFSNFVQRFEYISVEPFEVCVLCWFTWLDKSQSQVMFFAPKI